MTRFVPSARRSSEAGFTLVELLVSSAVLVLALSGSLFLFGRTNQISAATNARYSQQSLVDDDLARIRQLNDRYTCSSGSCTSAGGSELNKNQFFPNPPSTNGDACDTSGVACNTFETLCKSTGLITQLVSDIGTTPAALTNAGITYVIDSSNQGQATVSEFGTNVTRNLHRYTITYTTSSTGELLRRMTFVPTTVSWCP